MENSINKDLIQLFNSNPELITEYILYKENCIKKRVRIAAEKNISLEEYELELAL